MHKFVQRLCFFEMMCGGYGLHDFFILGYPISSLFSDTFRFYGYSLSMFQCIIYMMQVILYLAV